MVVVFIMTATTIRTQVLAQEPCLTCFRGEEPFTFDVARPGDEEIIECSEVIEISATLQAGTYVLDITPHLFLLILRACVCCCLRCSRIAYFACLLLFFAPTFSLSSYIVIIGTAECLSNQLKSYQGGCCDFPPDDYCSLCGGDSDGSSANFNGDKIIPLGPKDSFEFTCTQIAEGVRYLQRGTPSGNCDFTERGRAKVWCECDNIVQEETCALVCPTTNLPPPDLTLFDPIFNKSCERFMYEYSTLTADECPNAAEIFNFDAISFCCPDVTEPPNTSCSICPEETGGTLSHPEKPVETEFFGLATCGEMEIHASYLPNTQDACIELLFELDLRDGEDCCDLVNETVWEPPSPPSEENKNPSNSGGSGNISSSATFSSFVGALLLLMMIAPFAVL